MHCYCHTTAIHFSVL